MIFIRLKNSQRQNWAAPSEKNAPRAILLVAILGVLALLLRAEIAVAGTLEIRIKDHRDAIGDFSRLEIVIDKVRISPKAGAKFWQIGWKDLTPSPDKIDLTKYTGKRSATIFRGELGQGSFEGVHLKLKEIEGVLKKTKGKAAVKNAVTPIQLGFSIGPKGETLLILDLTVLDMSDHPGRGYEIHLNGYELHGDGKLVDKVPPG